MHRKLSLGTLKSSSIRILGQVKEEGGDFAKCLKMARTLRGVTQKTLAIVLGIDETTVSNWETRECGPSGEHFARLIEVLPELSFFSLPELQRAQ